MDAYSMDLRTRVAEAYDRGEGTQAQLAQRFRVSARWIQKLLRQRRETGSFAPQGHAGGGRVMEVKGEVLVVTGGGAGIGAGLAREGVRRGAAAVAVADADGDRARAVADELGGSVHAVPCVCDVSSHDAVAALAEAVVRDLGTPGVVCSNAGVTGAGGPLVRMDPGDVEWVLGVNVRGVWNTCSVFGRLLRRAGAGWLLNTGSEHSLGVPEYVIEMVRDRVLGECAASARDRKSLLGVWDVILRRGGAPVGQAVVAREAGLANNTVAAGYLELLADLMCLGFAHAWDADRKVAVRRKPAKFPPINLLAAVAFDRARLRTPADLRALSPEDQGRWLEWLAAQEIARRAAVRGDDSPEILHYWQGGGHELDYVVRPDLLVEVKRGGAGPFEFAWFARTFPRARLLVVASEPFDADRIRGLSVEEFLADPEW